jgi:lipoprotein signal peptidase
MTSLYRTVAAFVVVFAIAMVVAWFVHASLWRVGVGVVLGGAVGAGLLRLVNWLTNRTQGR